MQVLFSAALDLSAVERLLAAGNAILAVLLVIWIVRHRRLADTARFAQSNIEEMIENLSEGIYRSRPDGTQVRANKALVQLNGYSSESEMLGRVRDIGLEWYVDPARRDQFKRILERDGKVVDFVSEIHRHKTRERIWVSESARLVRDEHTGKPLYYEGSVREITETVNRLKLEEQFSRLVREVPGALFQFTVTADRQAVTTYISPGFERITGIGVGDQRMDWRRFIDRIPLHAQALYADLGCAGNQSQPFDVEHEYVTPDGTTKWLRVSATPENLDDAVVWHGYMSDVTLRKQNQMAVERLAYFDPLTGLPNRRSFLDRMGAAVEACGKRGGCGALLFIDLDNFKSLNDSQGHDVGDRYLVEVAARLQSHVGGNELVARIGGDEFVVVSCDAGPDHASAMRQAIGLGNRLAEALRQPFDLATVSHRGSASIGVVAFDGTSATPDEILKQADLAMYETKSSGRDGLTVYDPLSMQRQADRYRLLAELRSTLGRGGDELALHFQPLVDGAGDVVAAEALIRWNHPQRGTVMPDSFIQLAEQFGLICEIGEFVLARAVETLARWRRDPRMGGIGLAVNLSVQCLQDETIVPYLRALLLKHQLPGHLLTIEVTEHVMAQDQSLIAKRMYELKALGLRMALDDFGTGYSSLTYLKTLPFDQVKIDGSFVEDIETAESDRTLVKTILAMAHTLGLVAVAERVETLQQEAFLRSHGCDRFQGWLYAKAMPEAALAEFVASLREEPRRLALSA